MERTEVMLLPPEEEGDESEQVEEQNDNQIEPLKFNNRYAIIDDEHSATTTNHEIAHLQKQLLNGHSDSALQKLEEKAQKAQEAFEKEEKMRKELEALNSKLLAEKTALLDSLSGEKGALQEYQEKTAKLTAQKNDCENQLRVSTSCHPSKYSSRAQSSNDTLPKLDFPLSGYTSSRTYFFLKLISSDRRMCKEKSSYLPYWQLAKWCHKKPISHRRLRCVKKLFFTY